MTMVSSVFVRYGKCVEFLVEGVVGKSKKTDMVFR
jgi:hypothetical protein